MIVIQPREGREEKPFGWIVQNAQARWKERNEKTRITLVRLEFTGPREQ